MKKVNYEFVTGEVVEVEVSECWEEVLKDMNRVNYNNEKKETRRHVGLNTEFDASDWLVDETTNPSADSNFEFFGFKNEKLERAMSMLTEPQRQAVLAVYIYGFTAREYAVIAGVKEAAVSRLIERAFKNIRTFFEMM